MPISMQDPVFIAQTLDITLKLTSPPLKTLLNVQGVVKLVPYTIDKLFPRDSIWLRSFCVFVGKKSLSDPRLFVKYETFLVQFVFGYHTSCTIVALTKERAEVVDIQPKIDKSMFLFLFLRKALEKTI